MNLGSMRGVVAVTFLQLVLCGTGLCAGGTEVPPGWLAAGDNPHDYEMGADHTVAHAGKASGYIAAKIPSAKGFGTMMQVFKADDYRGKRIRLSGYVKAENIENWAGLWMRVDGPENKVLGFDNMQNRPIRGTADWKKYEIVLDVPENSLAIAFGILLAGQGRAWIDDLLFEVVDKSVRTTNVSQPIEGPPREPQNLEFEH